MEVPMSEKRVMTLLSLEPEARQMLIELATREGCSITEYVRRMVREQWDRTFKQTGGNDDH
jgi:hypothetical protein